LRFYGQESIDGCLSDLLHEPIEQSCGVENFKGVVDVGVVGKERHGIGGGGEVGIELSVLGLMVIVAVLVGLTAVVMAIAVVIAIAVIIVIAGCSLIIKNSDCAVLALTLIAGSIVVLIKEIAGGVGRVITATLVEYVIAGCIRLVGSVAHYIAFGRITALNSASKVAEHVSAHSVTAAVVASIPIGAAIVSIAIAIGLVLVEDVAALHRTAIARLAVSITENAIVGLRLAVPGEDVAGLVGA
jgi:hypothetical protein